MSENKVKKSRGRGGDGRSFIELWYSLPLAGKQMLLDALHKQGVSDKMVKEWREGVTPQIRNMDKVQKALLKCFGLRTKPYVLFPGKEASKELIERFAPKPKGWDGKVEWPSLQEDNEEKA